jgi:hypothetical protein
MKTLKERRYIPNTSNDNTMLTTGQFESDERYVLNNLQLCVKYLD